MKYSKMAFQIFDNFEPLLNIDAFVSTRGLTESRISRVYSRLAFSFSKETNPPIQACAVELHSFSQSTKKLFKCPIFAGAHLLAKNLEVLCLIALVEFSCRNRSGYIG
jgi:hypothetical protein